MNRYSELIELIEWYERLKRTDDCWIRYKMFENAIAEAPSIDIVRCRECKYQRDDLCDKWSYSHCVKPDDFCSYGEREK